MLESIKTKVIECISDKTQIAPEDITTESHLVNDLSLDSLDLVEIEFTLEREYSIALNLTEGAVPEKVGDIINMIAKKIA